MVEIHHGLEGVIAFETQIAEPDKEGSALRYRGVDIEDLVGRVPFGNVWGLLVDGTYQPGLPPAEPFPIPVHSGDTQAREDLARTAVMALSYVAQAARGVGQPRVPQTEIDKCETITERFMLRW